MNVENLRDRLDTWINMSNSLPIPPASYPAAIPIKAKFEEEQSLQMLINASELEVVPELIGTPAEKHLSEAIKLAKAGNASSLPEIKQLLKQVQEYMYKNGM